MIFRVFKAVAAALILMLGVLGSTIAAEARLSLNVRSGPGPDYPVVHVLEAGEHVNIGACTDTGNWCQVSNQSADGWAYAPYLDDVRKDYEIVIIAPVAPEPPSTLQVTVYVEEEEVDELTLELVDIDSQEPDRPRRNAVCFYEHPNYGGHSFCVSEGAGEQAMGSFWNDRISAIRVAPGAVVKVCDTEGLRGRCADVDRSFAYVGDSVNDIISSYQVY